MTTPTKITAATPPIYRMPGQPVDQYEERPTPGFRYYRWPVKAWNGKTWADAWVHSVPAQGGFCGSSGDTHWSPDAENPPSEFPAPTSSPGETTGGEAAVIQASRDACNKLVATAEALLDQTVNPPTPAQSQSPQDDPTAGIPSHLKERARRIQELVDAGRKSPHYVEEPAPAKAPSQTPMTDANIYTTQVGGLVLASFARTLETALAAAKERVGKLEKYQAEILDERGAFHGRAAQAEADRDALAEKLRRCEGERDESQSVIMATRQMSIEGMDAIRAAAGAPPSREDKSTKRAVDYVAELSSQLRELGEQLEGAKAKLANERAYIKKLDGLIEEVGGCTFSCINPYEDLKRALTGLKKQRDDADDLLAEHGWNRIDSPSTWLRTRLAALQQQAGEADKLAAALDKISDLQKSWPGWGYQDLYEESQEIAGPPLAAYRLARQPDQGQ